MLSNVPVLAPGKSEDFTQLKNKVVNWFNVHIGISTRIWPSILMVRRVQDIGPMNSKVEGDHVVVNFGSPFFPAKLFKLANDCHLSNTSIVLHPFVIFIIALPRQYLVLISTAPAL